MRSFVLFLISSSAVLAQSERGGIAGIIADPSGAAVAGVKVSVTNRDTGATADAITGSSGEYTSPNLPPGNYTIDIAAPGFKRFLRRNITVSASVNVRVDAQLQRDRLTSSGASVFVILVGHALVLRPMRSRRPGPTSRTRRLSTT